MTHDYNQYNPILGAASEGGVFSIQFTQKAKTGSDDTQTQNIYSANCYIEDGGDLF